MRFNGVTQHAWSIECNVYASGRVGFVSILNVGIHYILMQSKVSMCPNIISKPMKLLR